MAATTSVAVIAPAVAVIADHGKPALPPSALAATTFVAVIVDHANSASPPSPMAAISSVAVIAPAVAVIADHGASAP